MEPNSRCRSNGDSDLFQSHLLPGVKLRHIQNFSGLSSLLSPTNFECLRCLSGVHSVNSICATSSGLSHTQFFISSLVKAHWVRFFSGRLLNGQVSISSPLNLLATSRRTCGTKPFRTLAA